MTNKEAICEITKGLRIITGRGKKYLSVIPAFDARPFVDAVKHLVKEMKASLSKEEVVAISDAANGFSCKGDKNAMNAIRHMKRIVKAYSDGNQSTGE